MKLSQLFTKTTKDAPADEAAKNGQLLIQAGFIHKEMAGVYAYLPLGKRVLENLSRIVREEMDAIGGQEVQMSVLQPKDIWEKTNRWDDKVVDNWFKTKLVNGTELGVGLTHEEAVVDSVRDFLRSYKDLPFYPYQIETKFRNELRSKSGLMRGREFLMKDLYSFSRDMAEHEAFYEKISEAYHKIYRRVGIGATTFTTFASGGIFSKFSREYQTLSDVGEDTIYLDREKGIAINEEVYNDEVIKELGLNKDKLEKVRSIEVGNIFPLGSKYSDALDVFYVDESGAKQSVVMGSYGFGVSRLMGVIAETMSDEKGLVWPVNIAPAIVYIARLGEDKEVVEAADVLYQELTDSGIEVLYDDRDARAGEKFSDADLMGIPYRVVISAKTVARGKHELKARTEDETKMMNVKEILAFLSNNQ
jgi:prolyl-tRNA synthetase